MVTKRFVLTFPTGTIVFDAAFDAEIDADYLRSILTPDVCRSAGSFQRSPLPNSIFVVLSNTCTEPYTTLSAVSFMEEIDYLANNLPQVSIETASDACPESTYLPTKKLCLRLERILIAKILGILLAVNQFCLFETLVNACLMQIKESIKCRQKQYQAFSEIILTAVNAPWLTGGPDNFRPRVIKKMNILKYLRTFDYYFENILPTIGSRAIFGSYHRAELRKNLIYSWQYHRLKQDFFRFTDTFNSIIGDINKPSISLSEFGKRNYESLWKILSVYPEIVNELIPSGVLDAIVLWNETQTEFIFWPYNYRNLSNFIPERPFLRQLPSTGYDNIYRLVRSQFDPESIQILYIRLYDILANPDGVLGVDDAKLFHDGLNNEIVIDALKKGDLYRGLERDDIKKIVYKTGASFGLAF